MLPICCSAGTATIECFPAGSGRFGDDFAGLYRASLAAPKRSARHELPSAFFPLRNFLKSRARHWLPPSDPGFRYWRAECNRSRGAPMHVDAIPIPTATPVASVAPQPPLSSSSGPAPSKFSATFAAAMNTAASEHSTNPSTAAAANTYSAPHPMVDQGVNRKTPNPNARVDLKSESKPDTKSRLGPVSNSSPNSGFNADAKLDVQSVTVATSPQPSPIAISLQPFLLISEPAAASPQYAAVQADSSASSAPSKLPESSASQLMPPRQPNAEIVSVPGAPAKALSPMTAFRQSQNQTFLSSLSGASDSPRQQGPVVPLQQSETVSSVRLSHDEPIAPAATFAGDAPSSAAVIASPNFDHSRLSDHAESIPVDPAPPGFGSGATKNPDILPENLPAAAPPPPVVSHTEVASAATTVPAAQRHTVQSVVSAPTSFPAENEPQSHGTQLPVLPASGSVAFIPTPGPPQTALSAVPANPDKGVEVPQKNGDAADTPLDAAPQNPGFLSPDTPAPMLNSPDATVRGIPAPAIPVPEFTRVSSSAPPSTDSTPRPTAGPVAGNNIASATLAAGAASVSRPPASVTATTPKPASQREIASSESRQNVSSGLVNPAASQPVVAPIGQKEFAVAAVVESNPKPSTPNRNRVPDNFQHDVSSEPAPAAAVAISADDKKSASTPEPKSHTSPDNSARAARTPASTASSALTSPPADAAAHEQAATNSSPALVVPVPLPASAPVQARVATPPAAPQVHQMLDSAPPATPSAAPVAPAAADVPPNGQMHVGMRTDAFGAVQIHTVVQQSQVGITVHSDRDLARWFASEVPSLESGLNHNHLNLAAVDFASGRSGVQTSAGFHQGQPEHSFSQRPATPFVPPVALSEPSAAPAHPEIVPSSQVLRPDGTHVSILV